MQSNDPRDLDPRDFDQDNSGKEISFITVMGRDRQGIVASVSALLYEHKINIEDISQKVMRGNFVMIMMVDFKESPSDLDEVRAGLGKLAEEMGLVIQIQHEALFRTMHRV